MPPVFKKGSQTDKTHNRPVSILPNLSKMYERQTTVKILQTFYA